MDTDYILHKVIRRIASWAVYSFFTENVPANGPIIVTATHHNMMLDPAVLSSAFPHMRMPLLWSKASLRSRVRRILLSGEYTSGPQESPIDKPLVIVPCAIVYTNKSKYRSNVRPFGSPIAESRRATVKLLTRAVQSQLVELTINAPDWDTLYAARMARDLLWEDQESLDRDEYVNIHRRRLVDLFSTIDAVPNFRAVRRSLLEYYSLQSAQLTNSVLSSLPLPRSLDPEETQAQNKVLFGMFFLMLILPITFMVIGAFLWFTPIGAILSATLVWLFASYHNKLIDASPSLTIFLSMKRVGAAWRVLIGYSLTALSQYTATHIPPTNEWVSEGVKTTVSGATEEPPVSPQPYRARRPRTGRVMRHVLRARAEAVRLLASCIAQLEAGPAEKRLRASAHLARLYGGIETIAPTSDASSSDSSPPTPVGWRHAHEVVSYLRSRGAKVAALERGIEVEWIALNSDGDLSSAEDKEPASPLR
ncbi:glycerol-3-phosphate-acyltransferase [Lactarius hengduanensis]|nr:glycerol-3-phosphate-acyltransferase [Lactarius hengduanensis]